MKKIRNIRRKLKKVTLIIIAIIIAIAKKKKAEILEKNF